MHNSIKRNTEQQQLIDFKLLPSVAYQPAVIENGSETFTKSQDANDRRKKEKKKLKILNSKRMTSSWHLATMYVEWIKLDNLLVIRNQKI